jgi:hypothetical protein
MVLRDRDLNLDGDMLDAGERHYAQHDANFNVTALTDPTGRSKGDAALFRNIGQIATSLVPFNPVTSLLIRSHRLGEDENDERIE